MDEVYSCGGLYMEPTGNYIWKLTELKYVAKETMILGCKSLRFSNHKETLVIPNMYQHEVGQAVVWHALQCQLQKCSWIIMNKQQQLRQQMALEAAKE